MKICFLLLVLPFISIAQSTQQYLVTTSNDTIYYKGDLIVNKDDITQWRWVTADGTDYTITEINAAYFNDNYYYNCDGRHLYKQVVKGKINVYALNESDTLGDQRGNLRKAVYIEKDGRKPVIYSLKNLLRMTRDNESLTTQINDEDAKRIGGNTMIIAGILGGVPTTIGGLFVAFIGALIRDDQTTNNALTAAGVGIAFGSGMISGGAALLASATKPNLELIHWYNTH